MEESRKARQERLKPKMQKEKRWGQIELVVAEDPSVHNLARYDRIWVIQTQKA